MSDTPTPHEDRDERDDQDELDELDGLDELDDDGLDEPGRDRSDGDDGDDSDGDDRTGGADDILGIDSLLGSSSESRRVARSGRPDAAARRAEAALDVRRRMRDVTEAIITRAPEHEIEPTLDRIASVLDLLGSPQRAYPSIHVTGTNGKTSTTRMIERLLLTLGITTGRFTSPHLHSITERIVLSGEPIAPEKFLSAYDDVMPYVEMVDARSRETGGARLSFFEVLVAMGYAAFADAPVEAAVVEVGMGGAWDATNVIDSSVAVFTPIAIDHERYLGSSIEEIATEKSGIIKPGSIVVSAAQDPVAAEIILAKAGEVGAPVVFASGDVSGAWRGEDAFDTDASMGATVGSTGPFGAGIEVVSRSVAVGGQLLTLRGLAGDYPDIFLPLHGPHQASNALLALATVEAFVGGGEKMLDVELVRQAFASVTSPGRLEIVRRSPTVLVDSAHNPAGARSLVAGLDDAFTFGRVVGLFACMADKDVEGMLEILEPAFDEIVVTRTSSDRGMRAQELGELAAGVFGENRVTVEPSLPDALDKAAELADQGGVSGGVVACGSVFTAAEVSLLVGHTDV